MSEGPPGFSVHMPDARDLCMPRFYMKPMPNAFQTKEQGRPIFDEVEYVEIIVPGNRGTVVDERVKAEHKERWPGAYDAFKKGQDLAESGTPLEQWAGISRGQVEELKHFHVRSVETLAGLDDAGIARALPFGGNALRESAQRFLEQAKGSAPLEALAAENARQHDSMEVMKGQMEAMAAEIARLKNPSAAGAT